MKGLFSLDSKLIQGLSMVGDFIILNILYFILCLPVVTIGAARTALARVMFDMIEDRGYIYKRFFKTFASEFKTVTPIWLLELAALLLIGWELLVVYANAVPMRIVLLIGLLILFLLIGSLFSTIPLQVSRFAATRREYLKNAVYILITQLPRCLIAGIFFLFPALLTAYNPGYFATIGPLWMLLYFSVTTNLTVRLFRKPFEKYIDNFEQTEQTQE